ncbi:MAG: hypothetical protein FJ388_11235 [Verrucomicrobia bacterium]|nr:hypothetical protein [Verrucomicrobiota bacterium]
MPDMRGPDKNRYLRAARRIESTEIPFQEDEIDHVVACRLLGKRLPWCRPFDLPPDELVELNLRAGNDLVFLADVWELGRRNHIDPDGRKHYVDGTIKTRADLKQITFPDMGRLRQKIERTLNVIEGTGMGLKYTPSQTAFVVTTAVGYQDYYECLLTDRAFIHEFQDRIHGFCMAELEMALGYPVDVVQFGAVICSGRGPIFNRELIEEFEYPGLRDRIRLAKSKGVVVSAHLDGDVREIIPDMIAMGVDVLNPIETCDGAQDIYELKRQYGDKLALHGNIDLCGALTHGTPEQVKQDVRRHIEALARGGGYIVASSHNITEAVRLENFFAMRDATMEYQFDAM